MPGTGQPRSGLLTVVVLLLTLAVLAVQFTGTGTPTPAPQTGSSGVTAAAITVGNSAAVACVDVDTCATPAVTGVTAGDALIVIVTEHTTTAGNPSAVEEVTAGGDHSLTLLGSSGCTVLGHGVVAIYGLADASAETSVTFSANYTGDEYYTIHALDVHGAAAAPFETAGAPVCSTAAGTEASASVTTTVANDLAILGVEVRADEAIAATGGDTLVTLEEIAGADSDSGSMLDELDSGTGALTLSATFGSAQYAAIAVAIKPGSTSLVPGVVSPATASIDAGQNVLLTSTAASDGSGSYSYQWYSGSASCSSGTAIPGATALSYTTPALSPGTYYYCVEDTDTVSTQTAYTNVAVLTVNPALTVGITPASPAIDAGQSVLLTANVAGGTGSDTYAWYADGTCSGAMVGTGATLNTGALAENQSYCVAVTDSSYAPVTAEANDTVTVSAFALQVSIVPSSPSIDSGQSVTLTAEPAGGTGPYTYAWYAGATCGMGAILATTPAYATPNLTATTSFCVAVTDASYVPATASASATVSVSSSALSVGIDPAAPAIDSGQNVSLTATPSGGTGPYSYAWYLYHGSCTGSVLATSPTLVTPTLSATTQYCVVVTDSSYAPASASALVTVTVSSAPLSVLVTPASPQVDPDQSVLLTATPSGGTGTDSYAWYLGGDCIGAVLGSSQTFQTPTLSTTTPYCVAVTDGAYVPVTATANDTITVASEALSVRISPSAPQIDSGQSVLLTATPSGGVAPDSFLWYADLSCSGTAVGTSVTYATPALTASQSYCVVVTDSAYIPEHANATVTISVTGGPLSVSIAPAHPVLDPGQTIDLTATPAGGITPYAFAWYPGGSCTGSVLATSAILVTPALSVTTTYCVAVTDNSSVPATATAADTVTVASDALSVTIEPSAPSIDTGQSITLTAKPAGGTSPDAYAWYAGSVCSGTVLGTAQTYQTPALTTSTTYCVAATDSAYSPATATATDTVSTSAAPLSVTITPASPSTSSGGTVTLTAVPAGGTGPDSFAWYAGTQCTGPVLGTSRAFTTPALMGAATYCVAVTDSSAVPATATASANVAVTGGGKGTGTSSSIFGGDWWLLVLAAAAVVVFLFLLLAGKRRKKKEPEEGAAGSASPAPGTSPPSPASTKTPDGSPPSSSSSPTPESD